MITHRPSAASSPFGRRPVRFLVLLAALLAGSARVASAMTINIWMPQAGEVLFSIEVEPSDRILDVKQQIDDQETSTYFAVSEQVLFFDEQELENDQTLADYSIGEDDVLELRLPRLEAEMSRILAQAGGVAGLARTARRLLAESKRFDRQNTASLRALNRARTPSAFNRAKDRLLSQFRRMDSSIGRFSASLRRVRTVFASIEALQNDLGSDLEDFSEISLMASELQAANAQLTKLRRLLKRELGTLRKLRFF